MRRVLALLLLQLTACSPAVTDWQPSEAQKAIRVDFVRLDHTVHYAPRAKTPSPEEMKRLALFLDSAETSSTDRVVLKAAGPLAAARSGAVEAALTRRGVRAVRVDAGDAPDDGVRLEIERYVATPPACPNWSKPPGHDPTNSLASNFGCATQVNLGLMVADPRDLVVGRQMGPADAEPGIGAVGRYRDGKVPMLPKDGYSMVPSVVINNGSNDGGGGAQ
jgi:pilus assembly protein CpaD